MLITFKKYGTDIFQIAKTSPVQIYGASKAMYTLRQYCKVVIFKVGSAH